MGKSKAIQLLHEHIKKLVINLIRFVIDKRKNSNVSFNLLIESDLERSYRNAEIVELQLILSAKI